jgi:hypothetical protein
MLEKGQLEIQRSSRELERTTLLKRREMILWAIKFLGRMTVKPTDDDSLEVCQGIRDLALFLTDHLNQTNSDLEINSIHQNRLEINLPERLLADPLKILSGR